MKINIDKLINSLNEVNWDYDFKIIIHKDGSAHLLVPDFILRDIKWAIEPGFETPINQVSCKLIPKEN